MKEKKFFSLSKLSYVPAIIVGMSFSFSASAMSLDEALVKAYNSNPTIKAERSRLESTNEQLPQAYSSFLPTITADYSRSKTEETLTNSSTDSTPTSRSINISQPIFNGFDSVYQVEQAKNNIAQSASQLKSTEQRVLTESVIVYIDVVRTREIVELSKNNESVLKEQLQATKDRFELGETTRTDVAQSETRVAVATASRIEAEGNYIEAIAEFKRVIGTDAPTDITMPENLSQIPESFETVLERSLSNNPSVNLAKYRSLSRKSSLRRSKTNLLPTVSLNGSLRRQSGLSSTRISSEIDTDEVSINVSVPLYQSGAEYSRIRQAKRDFENADFLLDEANKKITSDATNAWQQVLTTRAKTKANKKSVESATLALEGVRQEQEVGSRTTLDVLDAEQELFNAQVNLVTAIRNSVLAVYNVKSAMGELTAEDIGLEVSLYSPEKSLDKVKYKFIGF